MEHKFKSAKLPGFMKTKLPEWAVFALFVVLYLVVSAFHEPWFDEAQSWEIAKCDSFFKMLFQTTHYEGNPPLWYLILAVPAKLGVSFEIGLKAVGGIISAVSVFVLLFKSPFPRIAKLLLPFTYFFFYQYGIIVRPYNLMILAFLFAAICFRTKNTHPWRFVFALALLCETSSYCIVISGAIAFCWVLEIFKDNGHSVIKFLKDVRVLALFVLLVFACFVLARIMPASDASFIDSLQKNNTLLSRIIVAVTTLLPEVLICSSPWFSNDRTPFVSAQFSFASVFPLVIIQAIVLIMIVCFSSKRKLKYFLLPFYFYSFFGAFVFLSGHHLGIGFFLMVFWLWINTEDEKRFEIGRELYRKLRFPDRDKRLFRFFAVILCFVSLAVSFYWTASSSFEELKLSYSYGRDLSEFIKTHGMENATIAMSWNESGKKPSDPDFYKDMDTSINWVPVSLAAYFDRNLVYNFNGGSNLLGYVVHRKTSAEENYQRIEEWKKTGAPELMIGAANVELLTDNAFTISDYVPVFEIDANYIWKGNVREEKQYLMLRKDLLSVYKVEQLLFSYGFAFENGFQITDEMREQFEKGVPIEEILKPYLDELFGNTDLAE